MQFISSVVYGKIRRIRSLLVNVQLNGITRQETYVYHNIVTRSSNHCCRGKAISIKYSKCVFVAVVIQHSKRMRCVVICGLSGCKVVLHSHS